MKNLWKNLKLRIKNIFNPPRYDIYTLQVFPVWAPIWKLNWSRYRSNFVNDGNGRYTRLSIEEDIWIPIHTPLHKSKLPPAPLDL